MREVVAVLKHLLEPVDDLQFLEKRFAFVQRYGFCLSGLREDYEIIRLYDAWSSVLASFADRDMTLGGGSGVMKLQQRTQIVDLLCKLQKQ
jgi:hypothetical protein